MEDGEPTEKLRLPIRPPGEPRRRSDLEWSEVIAGQKPGDQLVRIARHRAFKRAGPGLLVVRPEATEPKKGVARALTVAKHVLIGAPLATSEAPHERLSKTKALAIFSSDALSSVAYATEEIMKVLILVGVSGLSLTLPIAMVIAFLLAIVATSYRQTIRAYPNGGGSYIVAKENLGTTPGLIAAASLMIDYTLTVAVSVAAGVAAITSAFPNLLPMQVELSVVAVILIMIGNLRGLRESGSIFAVPTYIFIFSLYGLIAYGLFRMIFMGGIPYTPAVAPLPPSMSLGILVILSAFAQGCAAMTGTEAIANGIPAFKDPSPQNARATLVWMAAILASLFLGVSILATHLNVIPNTQETVISQISRAVVGTGPYYYLLQIATALILFLAANTSFAGFPMLASVLAHDGFMPHQFSFRGDRLAFSNGIMMLAALAIALLIGFHASVDLLIPLYAVGVFCAFTLSQAGMVIHWRHDRGSGWRGSMLINGTGAVLTAIVVVVIASTKFIHGAWMVLALIPILVMLLKGVARHYQLVASQTAVETPIDSSEVRLRVVVPISGLNMIAHQGLAFAQAVSPTVTAVHVTDDEEAAEALQHEWEAATHGKAQLVIIESPYRSLVGPLLAYLDSVHDAHPHDTLMVVLPEFVPSRWWEHLLHNQTALFLKAALLFRPGVVVTNIPYHIRRDAASAQQAAKVPT